MSLPNRSLSSNLRHPSVGGLQSQSSQSPVLIARINEKKAELENLKQLQELSAGLAVQMQVLEEKISSLSDGTEAVATVLANWHDVMRAIHMASMKVPGTNANTIDDRKTTPLPQGLVRVPAEEE